MALSLSRPAFALDGDVDADSLAAIAPDADAIVVRRLGQDELQSVAPGKARPDDSPPLVVPRPDSLVVRVDGERLAVADDADVWRRRVPPVPLPEVINIGQRIIWFWKQVIG